MAYPQTFFVADTREFALRSRFFKRPFPASLALLVLPFTTLFFEVPGRHFCSRECGTIPKKRPLIASFRLRGKLLYPHQTRRDRTQMTWIQVLGSDKKISVLVLSLSLFTVTLRLLCHSWLLFPLGTATVKLMEFLVSLSQRAPWLRAVRWMRIFCGNWKKPFLVSFGGNWRHHVSDVWHILRKKESWDGTRLPQTDSADRASIWDLLCSESGSVRGCYRQGHGIKGIWYLVHGSWSKVFLWHIAPEPLAAR